MTLRGVYDRYTPRPFTRGYPMIAPYWADVDTRSGPGRVYYRTTTNRYLLKRAKFEVESTQRRSFNPTRIFIATWNNVGYYNRHYHLVSLYSMRLSFRVVFTRNSSLLFAAKQLPGCNSYRWPQHLCAVYLQGHPLDNWGCFKRKEWLWWLRRSGRYQLWCW